MRVLCLGCEPLRRGHCGNRGCRALEHLQIPCEEDGIELFRYLSVYGVGAPQAKGDGEIRSTLSACIVERNQAQARALANDSQTLSCGICVAGLPNDGLANLC